MNRQKQPCPLGAKERPSSKKAISVERDKDPIEAHKGRAPEPRKEGFLEEVTCY